MSANGRYVALLVHEDPIGNPDDQSNDAPSEPELGPDVRARVGVEETMPSDGIGGLMGNRPFGGDPPFLLR